MNWTRNCTEAAAGIIVLLALFWMQGCGLKLHPLLAEHNGGKELTDSQVDIDLRRTGYLETQARCLTATGMVKGVLAFGNIQGCAYLSCGKNRMWATGKQCTCLAFYWTKKAIVEELAHCHGWIDKF